MRPLPEPVRQLTVIVPIDNEGRVLHRFHAALCSALEPLEPLEPSLRWSALYVVDPGTDDTEQQLEALAEQDPRASAWRIMSHLRAWR
jgi:hypothetical protein